MPATLDEPTRQRLDDIVGRMEAAGESEDDIRFVVSDFQSKYATQPQAESKTLPASQSPFETGARAAAQAPGQTVMSAYSGLGRAAQTAADTLRQKLPGPLGTVAGNLAELYSYVPRHLGPVAKDIANESERVYAPDRALNPKAATVGAAIGQALPMAASAIVAGPSGPLALGAGQGMDQGLDQAEEMGITDPARKLALGAAYAGIEAGVERLGGFGSKAFTAPAKRTLMEMAKAGGKTVLSEGVEEPITGALQDASAVALAPPSYDSTELRPFVMSPMGVPVPNQSYFDRRGLETLGGLAGGAVGAGVQALANRSQPGTKNQEPETTSDPLAAFAATMPERAAVDPVSVEAGMFDAPAMEGDILRGFNVQPDVATRVSQAEQEGAAWDAEQAARQAAYNQQFPILPEDQRAQLDDIVTRMEAAGEPESAIRATVAGFQTQLGTRNQEPGTSSASVTPEASPVPIPEAPASAPVSPEADAGSTPAAGASLDSRATSSPMASDSGAAQNANEPSPGGLSVWRSQKPDKILSGRYVALSEEFADSFRTSYPGREDSYVTSPLIARVKRTVDLRGTTANEQIAKKFEDAGFDLDEKVPVDTNQLIPHDWTLRDWINDPNPKVWYDLFDAIDPKWFGKHADGIIFDEQANDTQGQTLWVADPKSLESVNPNLKPTGAGDRATGFKNLDTSGTTAGFLNADIINEGASLIAQGVRDFAAWSKAMVQKFGTAIRDYLQGAWQAAMKTSEQGFIGGDPVRLTHEAERARMEAEGKEPLPTGGQFTVEQVTAEAAARVRNGEAPALLRSLETEPRILTPLEHYMLMNYAGALESAIATHSATLADPSTSPEARTRAAAEKSIATEERIKIAVAAQIAGSKAGAALGARSRGIDRAAIPSLAEMIADITLIQDPTGRTPLPPEDRAVIEKTHEKMVEAEKALDKQREEGKGGAQETFNTELQRLLDEAKAEIAEHQAIIETQREILKDKGAPVKLYTKSKAKLQEWSDAGDAAMQRLRDKGFFAHANMGVDVSVIGDLAEVLRGWMSKGVLNTASLTAKLMTTMGEKNFMQVKKFLPQIFDKADQLAREGAKKKTPEEILAKGRKAAAANDGKLPRSLARQLALAHIVDHIERKDKTLSAAKIADLVRADLEEFQPGITTREARDLISGYGQATFPSKDEARAELRNLAAQMQKITQLEALRNKERLLKSGPQRDKPSAELRELQKQVEELKKEIGYEARSKEDELKSARDRIKTHLENQIEELQRVLAGKARPANPREAVVYDAELNALKDLRGSLRDLVAEMPEHKLASEARRNKAALKSAQKSEAEWNRRAKAMQWKRPGKPPAAVSAEVDAARAKAKEARANFEALRKAADPRNDPEAKALRDFKRRTQKSIDDINAKIRDGAFDPPKKTPKQIKHDQESEKLRHELVMKKREWIDLKLQHRMATMGWGGKGLEFVRKLYHLARSLKAGGEFSGVLNQGMIPMVTHPLLTFGSIPKMFKAFVSPQNETAIMDQIWARGNSINGRYKKHKLAINDHMDYSTMQAEGNYRSAWGNKIPFFAGTGRAYTTLLNHMRADLFDHLANKLEARKARRNETVTDRELDMIAEEVNNSTGHGKLPFGLNNGNAKDLLGAVIFSPSFVMARARYLAGTSLWGGSKDSRAIIATERIRAMAGFAALYALALAMQGDDDEEMNLTEPRDSTWMKPKLNRTYIDLLAGLQQIAVLFSRFATGTSITNGKKTDLTDPNGRMDRFDLLMRFGKSKRSPALTMADEFINRKDYNGKPITRAEAAWNSITPITAGSIRDLIENEPPELAIPLSAGAFFGLRTDTRAPRQ